MNEPAVGKQRAVLLHEGGEGGETAAETRGEEHAQVGVHDVSALKQCVEHTYDKHPSTLTTIVPHGKPEVTPVCTV